MRPRALVACAIAVGGSLIASKWLGGAKAFSIPAVPAIASTTPSIAVGIETLAFEPPAPPEPPLPAGYVAQHPKLDAECIGQHEDATCDSDCEGTRGFPAISADRRMIVDAPAYSDGLRGYPGVMLAFTEVATGKRDRTLIILDGDEWQGSAAPAMRNKIQARVAAAQRELDAAGYRSLHQLGETQLLDRFASSGDPSTFHGRWRGRTVAIVDPATRAVIGRHTFTGPPPASTKRCSFTLHAIGAWWDPVTSVGFGRQHYASESDACDSPAVEQVFEL